MSWALGNPKKRAMPGNPLPGAGDSQPPSETMANVSRVIPKWEELQTKIAQRLQEVQGLRSMEKESSGLPVSQNDKPEILYIASRHPNRLQTLIFYSANSNNYFVSFDWGTTAEKREIKVWVQSHLDVNTITHREFPIETKAYIKKVCYNTSQHILVAYCDDLYLRVYADYSQKMKPLASIKCPFSVISMAYNDATGELVTGAVGAIVFWAFNYGVSSLLSVSKVINITYGYFVNHIMFEKHASWMLAICEDLLKVFDYHQRIEVKCLRNVSGASLTCCTLHWLQRYLYAGDVTGYMHVWSFDTSSSVYEFKAHHSAITSIVLRQSVHTLFTASMDHLVKEWSLSNLELLRSISQEEPVLHFQMINQNSFYCHTTYTFTIWSLNTFYKLFNATASSVKKLAWVQCSANKARIIATTEDGVIRFLSPVTGELLLLTWPFLVLEKATDYVYDPDLEELFVAIGSGDVLVLDTTLCPSPAKYIVTTSETKEDKVSCLVSSRQKLGDEMAHLVFSGHKSGQIRLLSPHTYSMGEHKVHNGGVLAMCSRSMEGPQDDSMESRLLCSVGTDSYISLRSIVVKGTEIQLKNLTRIFNNGDLPHIRLIPGHVCAITDANKIRFWNIEQSLLPSGKTAERFTESEEIQTSSIAFFDFCPSLGLILTGGKDGTIRLWDAKGILQAEFLISQEFTSTCFANARGDLLVGINTNIYWISSLQYLPEELLRTLASKVEGEDCIEKPLPFLPSLLLSFDTILVPKYLYSGKKTQRFQAMRSKAKEKGLIEEDTEKVANKMTPIGHVKHDLDEQTGKVVLADPTPRGPKYTRLDLQQPGEQDLLVTEDQLPPLPEWEAPQALILERASGTITQVPLCALSRKWPIAPDGYIPNSVIRAVLWPGATPHHLLTPLFTVRVRELPEHELPDRGMSTLFLEDDELQSEETGISIAKKLHPDQPTARDLLTEIAKSAWLGKKLSKVNLYTVVRAVLQRMTTAALSLYHFCTQGLARIFEAYVVPQDLREQVAERLYEDTSDQQVLKRMEAWKTLVLMKLMGPKALNNLARSLLDPNEMLRDLARSILESAYKVTTNRSLLKLLKRNAITLDTVGAPTKTKKEDPKTQGSAEATDQLCIELAEKLTEDLHLMPAPATMKDTSSAGKAALLTIVPSAQPKLRAEKPDPGLSRAGKIPSGKRQKKSKSEDQVQFPGIKGIKGVPEIQTFDQELKEKVQSESEPSEEKSEKKRRSAGGHPRRDGKNKPQELPEAAADMATRDSAVKVYTELVKPQRHRSESTRGEPKRKQMKVAKVESVAMRLPTAHASLEITVPTATPVPEPRIKEISTPEERQQKTLKKADRFAIDPKEQYQTDYAEFKKSLHKLISLHDVKTAMAASLLGEQGTGSRRTSPMDTSIPREQATSTIRKPSKAKSMVGQQDASGRAAPKERIIPVGQITSAIRKPLKVGGNMGEQDVSSGRISPKDGIILDGKTTSAMKKPSKDRSMVGEQDIPGRTSPKEMIIQEDQMKKPSKARSMMGEQDASGRTSPKDEIVLEDKTTSAIKKPSQARRMMEEQEVYSRRMSPPAPEIVGEKDPSTGSIPQKDGITKGGEARSPASKSSKVRSVIGQQDSLTGRTFPEDELMRRKQDTASGKTSPKAGLIMGEEATSLAITFTKARNMTQEQIDAPRIRSQQRLQLYPDKEPSMEAQQSECPEDQEVRIMHPGIHESLRRAALLLPRVQLASLWSGLQITDDQMKTLREVIASSPASGRLTLPPLLKLSDTDLEAALKEIFCEDDKRAATPEGKKGVHWKTKMADDSPGRSGAGPHLSHDEALKPLRISGQLPPLSRQADALRLMSRHGGEPRLGQDEGSAYTGRGAEDAHHSLDYAFKFLSGGLRAAPAAVKPGADGGLDALPVPLRTITTEDMTWERFQGIIPFLAQLEPLYRKDREEWQSILSWLRIQRKLQSPASRVRAEDTPGRSLPGVLAREGAEAAMGQRVLRRMHISGPKGQHCASFHHIIPLPWQNNVHTLYPAGESIFGALELNWVTTQHPVFMQSEKTLPCRGQ